MGYEPTPKQTLLLWDVLGRGGAAAQAEVPFKVETKDRDALERAGFLKKSKIGRALWLNVEEAGWTWASDHLDASLVVAPAPKKSAKPPTKPPAPPKVPTLQNWLTHLSKFLTAKNLALADVLPQIAPPPPPPPPPPPGKSSGKAVGKTSGSKTAKSTAGNAASASKSGSASPPTDVSAIEAEVRGAVATLQGTPQRDGVRLSALRKQLAHVDPAALDAALLALSSDRKVILMNLDNPRDIEAEGDAGIPHKGQLLQVLWLPK